MTHSSSVEMMAIEFLQIKQKWHLSRVYKLATQTDSEFAKKITKTLKTKKLYL